MEQQLTKLKDANGKYKNLLKMAKERIQDQDDELELLKCKLLHMYSHFRLTFCLQIWELKVILDSELFLIISFSSPFTCIYILISI